MSRGSQVGTREMQARVSMGVYDPPVTMTIKKRMMKGASFISRVFSLALGAFALVTAGGGTLVKADSDAPKDLPGVSAFVPLEKIVDKAMAQRAGHLIEAELKSINGQDVYEIELLDEGGKVWEMYFSAKTGELLKQGEEKRGEDTGR